MQELMNNPLFWVVIGLGIIATFTLGLAFALCGRKEIDVQSLNKINIYEYSKISDLLKRFGKQYLPCNDLDCWYIKLPNYTVVLNLMSGSLVKVFGDFDPKVDVFLHKRRVTYFSNAFTCYCSDQDLHDLRLEIEKYVL